MTALTVAGSSLRRYLRDRTALFFVIALPIMVITVMGLSIRGFSELKIAVVSERSGTLGRSLATALDRSPSLKVTTARDADAARLAVRRSEVEVAVVVPPGTDDALRAGRTVHVAVYVDVTSSTRQAALSTVSSVVANESSRIQAARFATENVGGTFNTNLRRATEEQGSPGRIEVSVRTVKPAGSVLPEGFAYSAPTMLVLFVFINALVAGAAVIESRQLGIYQRMGASPIRVRSIVLGETICYLSLALLQSVLIVSVGSALFGVDWGDPLAAGALLLVWALIGTGAGVLSGTLFRTPEQAAAISAPIGIVFGMLGGCMWPLAIVSQPLRAAGHLVPHAWAIDAWIGILSKGAGLVGIARPLAILAAFAAALMAVATVRLRSIITA